MFARFRHVPRSLLVLTSWDRTALFVPIIIVSFDRAPLVTTLALAIFIAADLYDGVLARELDADDTAQRTLDTAVDRLSISTLSASRSPSGASCRSGFARDLRGARGRIYRLLVPARAPRARRRHSRATGCTADLNLMLAGWVIAAPYLRSRPATPPSWASSPSPPSSRTTRPAAPQLGPPHAGDGPLDRHPGERQSSELAGVAPRCSARHRRSCARPDAKTGVGSAWNDVRGIGETIVVTYQWSERLKDERTVAKMVRPKRGTRRSRAVPVFQTEVIVGATSSSLPSLPSCLRSDTRRCASAATLFLVLEALVVVVGFLTAYAEAIASKVGRLFGDDDELRAQVLRDEEMARPSAWCAARKVVYVLSIAVLAALTSLVWQTGLAIESPFIPLAAARGGSSGLRRDAGAQSSAWWRSCP